ncbi:GntR family transcriptional regulator, partial [Bradyrhizobium sp. Arg68]|uniref:GntR family transcriptional regulator n=2 Tax=Bradyrhizobium TaxID=374 RepID=UPI001E461095
MSMQESSGVALWRQVADGIERGIADGRFPAGEKLPGEMEIAETYRVNRHTVRRAIAALAERGLVRAERGS